MGKQICSVESNVHATARCTDLVQAPDVGLRYRLATEHTLGQSTQVEAQHQVLVLRLARTGRLVVVDGSRCVGEAREDTRNTPDLDAVAVPRAAILRVLGSRGEVLFLGLPVHADSP